MVPLSTGFDIEIKYPNIEQQKKLKVGLALSLNANRCIICLGFSFLAGSSLPRAESNC